MKLNYSFSCHLIDSKSHPVNFTEIEALKAKYVAGLRCVQQSCEAYRRVVTQLEEIEREFQTVLSQTEKSNCDLSSVGLVSTAGIAEQLNATLAAIALQAPHHQDRSSAGVISPNSVDQYLVPSDEGQIYWTDQDIFCRSPPIGNYSTGLKSPANKSNEVEQNSISWF